MNVIAALKRVVAFLPLALLATVGVSAGYILQPRCEVNFCSVKLPGRNDAEIVAYWDRWEAGVYLQRYSPPAPSLKIGIVNDPDMWDV